MRSTPLLTLVATGLMLGACADFYSIGRTRVLPDDPASNKGLAIHLDAQQRLMMVSKNGNYCAEASPDAMAAYAAALAASASAQGYGSGSASNASQSNIASIGLRTQSITLMRDALYRLCEAAANGQISEISQTQLMARSQDLTAVVVAVEQLTGSTAASQALLTGTSSASATATAIGSADQLAVAEENLQRKTEAREKAEEELKEKDRQVAEQTPIATQARDSANSPPEGSTDAQKAILENQAQNQENKLASLTREQGNLQTRVGNAKKAEDRAREISEKVAASGVSSDSSTTAGTTGAGQFASTNPSRDNLTDASSQAIAASVESMVKTVLNKDYTAADCMVLLTNITDVPDLDANRQALLQNTLVQCERLLSTKIQAEANKYSTGSYEVDDSTDRLESALETNPAFRAQLEAWLLSNAPGLGVTHFLTHKGFAQLRSQAVSELL